MAHSDFESATPESTRKGRILAVGGRLLERQLARLWSMERSGYTPSGKPFRRSLRDPRALSRPNLRNYAMFQDLRVADNGPQWKTWSTEGNLRVSSSASEK